MPADMLMLSLRTKAEGLDRLYGELDDGVHGDDVWSIQVAVGDALDAVNEAIRRRQAQKVATR